MYYDTMIYEGKAVTKKQFEEMTREMTFEYDNRFGDTEIVSRIGNTILYSTYTSDGDQISKYLFTDKEIIECILSEIMEAFDEREYTEDDSIGYLYSWE